MRVDLHTSIFRVVDNFKRKASFAQHSSQFFIGFRDDNDSTNFIKINWAYHGDRIRDVSGSMIMMMDGWERVTKEYNTYIIIGITMNTMIILDG